METWRRLGPARLAPDAAVARPGRLLDDLAAGAGPVLSWSTVTAPALVLGRAARDPDIDRALAAREGIVILGRGSGGGAVLWDRDLVALDVALPAGHPLVERDVVRSYRWLGEALADAMRDLGVGGVDVVDPDAAHADRRRAGGTAAACFGSLSPYEVTAGGRKLVGLSQIRRRQGALLQVGVPQRFDAALLARLLRMEASAEAALAGRTTGLRAEGVDVTTGEVVAAVETRIRERAGAVLSPVDPGPEETPCG